MQYKNLLALAPFALAAPLETRTGAQEFGVIVTRSDSPIQYATWTTRRGGIYLNGESSASCPGAPVDCSDYSNKTTFSAQPGLHVALNLNTGVPGGQQVFVANDGALGYTVPHSASVPTGASIDGFTYNLTSDNPAFGTLSFIANGADGFVACPVNGEDSYQIYANVAGHDFSNCLGTNELTANYTGKPAWEFEGVWMG